MSEKVIGLIVFVIGWFVFEMGYRAGHRAGTRERIHG